MKSIYSSLTNSIQVTLESVWSKRRHDRIIEVPDVGLDGRCTVFFVSSVVFGCAVSALVDVIVVVRDVIVVVRDVIVGSVLVCGLSFLGVTDNCFFGQQTAKNTY
jgi:hypothetical protein